MKEITDTALHKIRVALKARSLNRLEYSFITNGETAIYSITNKPYRIHERKIGFGDANNNAKGIYSINTALILSKSAPCFIQIAATTINAMYEINPIDGI